MKKHGKILVMAILFWAVIGTGFTFFAGSGSASACGWGSSGGGDYVPQRRDSNSYRAQKPSLTKEQSYEIVSNHVKKLNPDLKIGKFNDAGNFYEAEILSQDNEVVQLIGVDKTSGRLILIN